MPASPEILRLSRLFAFFIPLGLTATLMTVSHVIINSTLARAERPEAVIASYAIAVSLMTIMDRPLFLLRQTCTVMVKDRRSLTAMKAVTFYVIGSVFLFEALLAYTPLGPLVLSKFYGVKENLMGATVDVYLILIFVCIFSGIRCFYQGIVIMHLRTKWMTVGMIVRLVCMYGLSGWYIATDRVNSGQVGGIIFLVGMMIECIVMFIEGSKLAGRLPAVHPTQKSAGRKDIFGFYRPILYSSFIALFIGPLTNAFLGRTTNIEMAIASFAIANSLMFLVTSFFSYTHQIVLNFYAVDRYKVRQFVWMLSAAPALLIALIGYTPTGTWFMQQIMGVTEQLMDESLRALRVFMILAIVFPWLDYMNGIVMLQRKTKMMVWSQGANVLLTLAILVGCIVWVPDLNGTMGSLAQSVGIVGEFIVVWILLNRIKKGKPS